VIDILNERIPCKPWHVCARFRTTVVTVNLDVVVPEQWVCRVGTCIKVGEVKGVVSGEGSKVVLFWDDWVFVKLRCPI
jgi:hypothetical protein